MAQALDALHPQPRLWDLETAAQYLAITPKSLQRLVQLGQLKPVKLPGIRRTLFDREDLDALVTAAKDIHLTEVPRTEDAEN
ncbi:MAG: helix-turn-helix transcriptional regulator [Candidatus Entotheonellia bacterium]